VSKRIPDEQVAEAASRVKAGADIREVASEVASSGGWTLNSVLHRIRKDMGIDDVTPDVIEAAMSVGDESIPIEREALPQGRPFVLSPEQVDECAALYADGATIDELCDAYGVSQATMKNYVIPGHREYMRARRRERSSGATPSGRKRPRLSVIVNEAHTRLGGVGDEDHKAPWESPDWPVLEGSPLMPGDVVFDLDACTRNEVYGVALTSDGWRVAYVGEGALHDMSRLSRKSMSHKLIFEMVSEGKMGYEQFERLIGQGAHM
jgi:hypothetical protein